MSQKRVIVVFDFGKTNKEVLLFDGKLCLVYENEKKFHTTSDEDGFECDDIALPGTYSSEPYRSNVFFKMEYLKTLI